MNKMQYFLNNPLPLQQTLKKCYLIKALDRMNMACGVIF